MQVKFFNPGKVYLSYKEEMDGEIQRVLANGDLILRQDVTDFEQRLAEFVGTKYAVSLNSGTDALYLGLKVAGIGKGDEVITCSHTFVATAQVIAQCGAKPVLVDMGHDGLMDIDKTIKKINKKTKAIIPVQLTGQICDMKKLVDYCTYLATQKGQLITILEDACQALGAEQDGKKAGSIGLMGAFSFYPAKLLGCYGDGGALVTNSETIYNEVVELRNHYKKDYSKWGINSRLDNLQAAVLNVKLKYLPEVLERRKVIAERYLKELKRYIGLPVNSEGRVWQDFIVKTKKRDELYDFLKERGIETMKNAYPFPIEKKKKSIAYEAQTLRIPCNEALTDDEVTYIIEMIQQYARM